MSEFFAKEGGITKTSAEAICARATQVKAEHEALLENISFINTTMDIVGGSGDPKQIEIGAHEDTLPAIQHSLSVISRMDAVIAWFREARKTFDAYEPLGWEEWKKNFELPAYPEKPKKPEKVKMSSYEDIVAEMDVAEHQRYLELIATSSVYGKFIHKDQPLEKARRRMHVSISKPYTTKGDGINTLIYHYETSIAPAKVDSFYLQLQEKWRNVEQELNKMKSSIRKKLSARNLEESIKQDELDTQYEADLAAWDREASRVTAQEASLRDKYNQYLREDRDAMAKVKFAVPKALENTVKELNDLGH